MKRRNRTFLVFDLFGPARSGSNGVLGALATALALLVGFFFLALGSLSARAADVCQSADVFSTKLITSLCWDCTFPLRGSGVTIAGSKNKGNIPDEAANQAF